MTPAETLTAAADLIERLAGDATPGPWEAGETTFGDPADGPTCVCVRPTGAPWYEHLFAVDGSRETAADAAYIAAMNPAVAILLVPVLRAEARHVADMYLHAANPNLLAFAQALIEGASK